MRDILKKNSGNGRRGGDLFATLLFVVAAFAFAAGTFALTDALMGSKDTTMSFVPMSATTYVHSNGYAATEVLLSSTPQMPAGIHPYEFGLFTAPGDDAPQHGIILAWSTLKKPSQSEVAVLNERGAAQLDECHYFFGDSSLVTAARVAAAAHVSLYDSVPKRAALSAMRSLYGIQVMTSPRSALSGMQSPLFDQVLNEVTPETAVIGAALHGTSFIARVTPLSVPLSQKTDRDTVSGLDPSRMQADVIVTGDGEDLNLTALLPFGTDPNSVSASGVTQESDGALRATFSSPSVMWMRESRDAGQMPAILFHFPQVSQKAAVAAIGRSFAERNPSMQNLALPDGDASPELIVDSTVAAGINAGEDVVFGKASGRIIIGSDGMKGSLVSPDISLINEYRNSKRVDIFSNNPCGSSKKQLTINNLARLKENAPAFGFLADRSGINAITFSTTVGNELYICGYRK